MEKQRTTENDKPNRKAFNGNVSEKQMSHKRKELSEAELIRRRKEGTKHRQEKLIETLERKKQKTAPIDQTGNQQGPVKLKTVFEVQEETNQLEGRSYTISLALPGSILDNAQSAELRTYLAGQVARALAVFNVDEVIVFNDDKEDSLGDGNSQLINILKFLECPQYLRKDFFPIHNDLKYAGVLNPTDMPHHLRAFEESIYREGIVRERKTDQDLSVAYIGLKKECELDQAVETGTRVTVKVLSEEKRVIKGQVVKPSIPREVSGLYWGYSVRSAENLSSIFTKSPFQGGYDLCIGTSERGKNIDQIESLPKFKHLLIVFGGM